MPNQTNIGTVTSMPLRSYSSTSYSPCGWNPKLLRAKFRSPKNTSCIGFGRRFKLGAYKENGVWKFHEWACTTDNGAGTARVVEGQYRGSHIIRKHQGKYDAVCQDRPIKVYRDYVADGVYDESKIQEGVFGINIHKAGADSVQVNNWSEGCQVFKREKDFNEFLEICKKAMSLHGNRFTYTLINSNDISVANPPMV